MNLDQATERSVIGAVLLEPSRYDEIREWLRPDDFDGVAERQAFEAMQDLSERGSAITAKAVDGQLLARRADTPMLADGPYLVSCMELCPSSSRAAVYGRMVLELSIRRRVAAQGVGLRQRAERAVTSQDLNMVFARVDATRRDVERLHDREAKASRSHAPTPLLAGELKPLQRQIRRDDVAVERTAVLALADEPKALSVVTRWLRPTDFADDECAGLYSELSVLHEAKNPIDRITLAWRAKRVGLRGQVSSSLLTSRDPATSAGPITSSRRVLEQSVRAAVVATADSLQGLAADGRDNATGQAYARLNHLWPQQRRLIKASLSST